MRNQNDIGRYDPLEQIQARDDIQQISTLKRNGIHNEYVYETDACVHEISEIASAFEGNIIPHTWYSSVVSDKGKPDFIAIILLSEIIHYYRWIDKFDSFTGKMIGLEKQFTEDMLQRTSREFAEKFNLTKSQVSSALARLEKLGIIIREFRTVNTEFGRRPNVQFIAPIPEKIREISKNDAAILPCTKYSEYEIVSSSKKSTGHRQSISYNKVNEETRISDASSPNQKSYLARMLSTIRLDEEKFQDRTVAIEPISIDSVKIISEAHT